MKTRKMTLLAFGAIVLGGCLLWVGGAPDARSGGGNATPGVKPVDQGIPLEVVQRWTDAKGTHAAWLDPYMVIQWRATDTLEDTQVRLPATVELARAYKSIRAWRLPHTASAAERRALADVVRVGLGEAASGTFLPVYRTRPNTDAPLRLFTNRVLAKMDPSWDRDAVETWAAQQGVTVVRQQSYDASTYLLRVRPEDNLLEKAEALRQFAGVLSVTPDQMLAVGR